MVKAIATITLAVSFAYGILKPIVDSISVFFNALQF